MKNAHSYSRTKTTLRNHTNTPTTLLCSALALGALAPISFSVRAEEPKPPLETIVVVAPACGSGQVRLQGVGCVDMMIISDMLRNIGDGDWTAIIENRGSGSDNARQRDCNDVNAGASSPAGKIGMLGNPVLISSGSKIEPEIDFSGTGELALYLSRTYNSDWDGVGIFGKQWQTNFDYKLSFGVADVNACYPRPGGGTCGIGANTIIWAHRPDGRTIKFVKNTADGVFYEEKVSPIAKIVVQPDGTFKLFGEDNGQETYSSAGYVSQIKNEYGIGWTFLYSGTYPTKVTHTSGRYIDFVWTGGQLTSVRDLAGNYYGYAYLSNRFGSGLHLLSAVSKPGTPTLSIAYHYEDTRFLGALTGKTYGGVRYSWFAYDADGRATLSHHGGNIDRNTYAYASYGNTFEVFATNPLGKQTSYTFVNGQIQSTTGHAATYCGGTYRESTYDANGYPDIASDFNGNLSDSDYNAKGQLLKQVEAAGTPAARTTEYVWDSARSRISSVSVVGQRKVDIAYTANNRVASIAQTNLSAHGVANQTRTTTYAYTQHANGMLATVTVDGPVAGSGDAIVTSYSEFGDLLSIANSLGHATTYSNHNGLGLPGRITGPNGAITDVFYDAQGRVTTERHWINGVAADTVYTYSAQGLLASSTASDGTVTHYEYSASRRLTRVWRTANGTVSGGALKEDRVYTYDNMGNITRLENRKIIGHYETQCVRWRTIAGETECVEEQQVWTETPTVTESQMAAYDELGRVRTRYGNNGQNNRFTYDDNGNTKTTTDSLNRVTTMVYDALDRIVTSTDPLGGITRFEYDAGDRITKVTDAKNLSTTYVYDGFGQVWAQNSPDTGVSSFQYDAAGLRTYSTRHDGSALSYVYDSLGRLIWYGTATQGRSFGYDWCSNGKNRLCEANYGDGARHYGYTPQGQIAVTRDFTAGLTTDDWTGYSYDNAGRLTGISYPSGISAGYAYSNGKLSTMTATINGATQVVAGSLNYHPFGGIANWTYGNNLQRQHQIDLDGRLTAIHTDYIQGLYYQYNANDEITQITNGADAGLTQTYTYDELGRLTQQNLPGNTFALAYDAIGNRTSRTDNGVTTNYAYPAANHRLQSAISPSLSRSFSTNAVGNVDGWHTPDGVYGTMTYDAYLRPKQQARNGFTTTYTFNAQDQRVKKYYGGGNTARFVYAGQNIMLAEHFRNGATGVGTWTNYLWLGGQPVGLVRNNTLYWIHSDHLGRPEMVTNASQQRVWRAANWAFNRGVVLDQIGGLSLGFPGQYYDTESNLWHNGFRDYEPTLGRYLQSDPIGLEGGVSTYSYVGGSPIMNTDLLGLCRCRGYARVLQGNRNLVGQGGGFDTGPSNLARYGVTSESAAVIPSQWGLDKQEFRPILDQISGGFGNGATFVGVRDIIDDAPTRRRFGHASTDQYQRFLMNREIVTHGFMRLLIIELPGASRDYGVQRVTLNLPDGSRCPEGTQ